MASTVTLTNYAASGGSWHSTLANLIEQMSADGGGLILVPPGTYPMSAMVDWRKQVHMQGVDTMRWLSTTPSTTIFQASTGFSGTALFRFADTSVTGYASEATGCSIRGISLDGNSKTGSGINGLEFYGNTRDNYFSHINSRSFSGAGVKVHSYGGDEAQELFFDWVLCYGNDIGWDLESPGDSVFSHCQGDANTQYGWSINNASNTTWFGCRAEWNLKHGWRFHTANSGGLLVGCSTDRNNWDGVNIGSAPSNQTITFVGLKTRRDGRNGGSGGGSYSGVNISGASGNLAPPVYIWGLEQEVARDDDGGGTYSPQVGVTTTYCSHALIAGKLWGRTTSISDAGTSLTEVAPGSTKTTGDPGSQTDVYHHVAAADGTLQLRSANLQLRNGSTTSLILDYGGVIDFIERSEPSAPSANRARLFCKDNGSGKTQLMVRFPSGASQQIAIEP